MSSPIRVLIVADSAVFRSALQSRFAASERFEVVGALDHRTASARIDKLAPDVAVVDGALIEGGEDVATVILAGEDTVQAEDRAHPHAILRRSASTEQLFAAVEAVAVGLTVRDPEHQPASEAVQPGGSLTAREVEVLRMMSSGLSNKTIGARLGISEHTVKFHVASILAKLNAGTRAEAVVVGIRRGLIYL